MQDVPYVENYAPSPVAALMATMIKFPVERKTLAYADLVCTEQDKADIYEIITLMADNGKISLLFKKGYIEDLGDHIQHVHPLKFLSTIVTNPRLNVCLDEIFDDYFKRNGFMDGIGPRLTKEAERGHLNQYIGNFSEEVGVPHDNLMKFFKNQDWEGLVRFFID